jgi:hypothetical protein
LGQVIQTWWGSAFLLWVVNRSWTAGQERSIEQIKDADGVSPALMLDVEKGEASEN